MKVIVESEREAVELARNITHICNDIRMSKNIPDMLQSAYENTLCQIRDSIEIGERNPECSLKKPK